LSSSRRRSRSSRTDSALRRGGRRFEPSDVTLRKQALRIQRVCRAWKLARATVQRQKALADGAPRIPAKRGPKTSLSEEQILAEIRSMLASTLFVGEGHRKVWAKLRHDHGSQFISHAFRDELKTPGIESSPSFVRQPEGNGCVERFIRTLKEQLLWLHRFRTVEELN
jgi:transposase InsO family protein